MKFYTSVLPFKGKLLVRGVNHDGSHKKYRINYKPDLLLLDEPLAALDKKLRSKTQLELTTLQKKLKITFVFVTHDQEEAMSLSDRMAIMKNGLILECSSPEEIYENPKSLYTANFIGIANIIEIYKKDENFYSDDLGINFKLNKELKNTIIINGVSKAYAMTGWRVGWLVANSNVIGLAKKIQSQISSNVSNISQIAAETALKNGLDVTEEMKISFNRRRLYAIEKINEINNISVGNPTGAFYLFVDVSQYCNGNYEGINSSIDFCNWLLDKYFIAFVPGEVFGAPGYMRLSYALSDDELSEGLERLNKAVEELNG